MANQAFNGGASTDSVAAAAASAGAAAQSPAPAQSAAAPVTAVPVTAGGSGIVATQLLAPHPSEQAYNTIAPELQSLKDDDNAHINVDVLESVTTVLGALPRIRALRAEIADQLPRFDLARFDKLETYTLALSHAHTWSRAALIPKAEVTERAMALEGVRDRLLGDAQALAGHGLIDAAPLKEVKSQSGHRPLASDVLTLVKVLKDNWPQLQGKTAQTAEALNAAAVAALELLAAVGIREQGGNNMAEPTVTRRKAFTLFRRAYEDARKAIVYLRGEEQAEELAPSLYAGRGGRRPAAQTAEQPAAGASGFFPTSNPASGSGGAAVASSNAAANGSSGTGTSVAAASGSGVAGQARSGADAITAGFAVDNSAGLPITHPLKG